MKDFRDLNVWQKAHLLTLRVYEVTKKFPKEEHYGLTSELRRSVVSIPSNFADGCGREGDKEMVRFLQIAMGSAGEAQYQLLLSRDIGYFNETEYKELGQLITDVKRMLAAFLKTLKSKYQLPTKKAEC